MKNFLFALFLFITGLAHAQYIGVKARYTETRLVNDAPNPPKRENRLILSFFNVTGSGNYIPVSLSNYDLYIYKAGLQYGNVMGGVLDSTGNNYDGYAWPAPKAVAYYNSYFPNYIDCDPNAATHYIVNGHDLDCGFITVSYWGVDGGTGNSLEIFPAPNVCLPYYFVGQHPYALVPGNVNFSWPVYPTAPYNWYSFSCGSSTQQLVIRGVLAQESCDTFVMLPVRFANVKGQISGANKIKISWSNMTESAIDHYIIERSIDGSPWESIGSILPLQNNSNRSDYDFNSVQTEQQVFYRIKAVETSGLVFYSPTIQLSTPKKLSTFSIFPNPVRSGPFVFLLTHAEPGRYVCWLLNTQGEAVRIKLINHNGGNLNRSIDLAGLPYGTYTLVLQSTNQRFTQKIIYVN